MTNPLLTTLAISSDWSDSELKWELERLYIRNQAIAALQNGELPAADLCEILADQGVDPDDWIAASQENLIIYG